MSFEGEPELEDEMTLTEAGRWRPQRRGSTDEEMEILHGNYDILFHKQFYFILTWSQGKIFSFPKHLHEPGIYTFLTESPTKASFGRLHSPSLHHESVAFGKAGCANPDALVLRPCAVWRQLSLRPQAFRICWQGKSQAGSSLTGQVSAAQEKWLAMQSSRLTWVKWLIQQKCTELATWWGLLWVPWIQHWVESCPLKLLSRKGN